MLAFSDLQGSEIPAMVATLCSYEDLFGPHHSQTLRLMVELADALRVAGDAGTARVLLERVIRDECRCPTSQNDGLRLRALTMLHDVLLSMQDLVRAEHVAVELMKLDRRACPGIGPVLFGGDSAQKPAC